MKMPSASSHRRFAHARLLGVVLCALWFAAARGLAQQPAPSQQFVPFEARVAEAIKALEGEPRLKDISHEQLENTAIFITGNLLFALTHELGHAVIDDMYLYVLGREEDAADSFASVTMLKVGNAVTDRVLVEATKGWFYDDRRAQAQGQSLPFYDAHGLDEQRAYQIICLMVGSNPDKYKTVADDENIPEERQGTCQGDWSTASWGWDKALKPYRRAPEQPKTEIKVTYGDAPSSDNLDIYANFLRSIRLLEVIAAHASNDYVWSAPLALAGQTCGESNAHWNHPTRTIVLCYEMAAEFAQLYRDYSNEWKPKGEWKRGAHKPKQ
jgi:hypothetical protein